MIWILLLVGFSSLLLLPMWPEERKLDQEQERFKRYLAYHLARTNKLNLKEHSDV